jgi:Fur family iron response transcriptional regulator
LLFNRKDTFHFTISDLSNSLNNTTPKKIALATIYNTINAFKKKGYLKEISINSDKTYFDTNISNHHHFFDESNRKLIDLDNKYIGNIKIKKNLRGKKIKSVEVLVKVANNN